MYDSPRLFDRGLMYVFEVTYVFEIRIIWSYFRRPSRRYHLRQFLFSATICQIYNHVVYVRHRRYFRFARPIFNPVGSFRITPFPIEPSAISNNIGAWILLWQGYIPSAKMTKPRNHVECFVFCRSGFLRNACWVVWNDRKQREFRRLVVSISSARHVLVVFF